MNPIVETYRGYKIAKNSKVHWHHNKVSGHWWAEDTPRNNFYISGPGARVLDIFESIKSCKEHIDFLIKFPESKDNDNT